MQLMQQQLVCLFVCFSSENSSRSCKWWEKRGSNEQLVGLAGRLAVFLVELNDLAQVLLGERVKDAGEPVGAVQLLLDLQRRGNRLRHSQAHLAVELVPPSHWRHGGVRERLTLHDGVAGGEQVVDEDGAGHGQRGRVAFDRLDEDGADLLFDLPLLLSVVGDDRVVAVEELGKLELAVGQGHQVGGGDAHVLVRVGSDVEEEC